MIIQHNISALNASNMNNRSNLNSNKAIVKLSSSLRINRAADDAAGLAISEKMRAQIRGLKQAERNIQDGISLIQTAEGGLAEIQEVSLQRLRELSVQASNDTLTNEDRQEMQKEVNQITLGINDIANNTEFNGINLMNIKEPNALVRKEINTIKYIGENLYSINRSVIESQCLSPPGFCRSLLDFVERIED